MQNEIQPISKSVLIRFLTGYPEIKHKYFPVLLGMGNQEMRNSPRLKVMHEEESVTRFQSLLFTLFKSF
jgi:hypothetical protein